MSENSRKERRRRQFLDAAKEIFAEKGYPATTVDDIVARVEVARGTFYLYFEDKKAVLTALLSLFFEQIGERIHRIDLEDAERTPREQLRDNLRRLFELALEDPAMVRILLHHATGVDAGLDERLDAFYTALRRSFVDESLKQGQEIGLVRPGNRQVMVSIAMGASKQLLLDVVAGEIDAPVVEAVEEVMVFVERGLLASPV